MKTAKEILEKYMDATDHDSLNVELITKAMEEYAELRLYDVSGSAFIANTENTHIIVVADDIESAIKCLEQNGYSQDSTIQYRPYKCLFQHYR